MKKIGRIYGEAKINMREMIGNRENTTEPPLIKRQTKNIEDIRQYLKEVYTRMAKQSKTNLLSIEENELVGNAFDEYGVRLREEGDFGSLGDVFVSIAAFHQSIEALRMRMDTALQAKVSNPFEEFIRNDVKRARYEKAKYDKARVSFDALHNKAKQMKKKGSIDKVVEVERELEDYKTVFEDIAMETVKVQSDVCEMHGFQTLERMCDYISIYEDFFTQGLHLAKQISKDLPAYRSSIKELKEEFRQKKLQRGEEDESGAKYVFGVALEEIVNRENNGSGVPAIMDHAIKYLYKNSLNVEGVFRVSGSQKEVMELKKKIERGIIDFSEVINDHNVSGILKLFLRELPAPLFPFNLYNPIIKVVQDSGKDETVCTRELKALIATIPPLNMNCLRYLLGLCHELTAHSSSNLMNARNLAVVLAPNILYSKDLSLEAVADSNGAIEYLVSHYKDLFPGNFTEWVTQPPVHVPAPAGGAPASAPSTPQQAPQAQAQQVTPRTPQHMSIQYSQQQILQYSQQQQQQQAPASPLSHSAPIARPPGPVTPGTPTRLPISAPAASPANNNYNNNINPPPPGKAPPVRRPGAVRGSSMFQFDSGNNNEDFVPLRKTSMGGEEAYAYNDEPVPVPPVNPRASTIITPGYPPGGQNNFQNNTNNTNPFITPGGSVSSSPFHSSPVPPARLNEPPRKTPAAPGPSPKQLPPRPPGKIPPSASLTASTGQLPPPPPSLSHPSSTYPSNYPVNKTTSSPSLSYLTPPPPLATPPLKPNSSSPYPKPANQDDLIQF